MLKILRLWKNRRLPFLMAKALKAGRDPRSFFVSRMEPSLPEVPTNLFMCTEKEFEDFDLSLKVRFQPYTNNGGIQIRSERIPNDHEVIGYQVDVGYAGDVPVWASVYDESRRNRFIAEADAERIAALLKKDDFNDYRILCKGPSLKVWFNGQEVIDYREEEDGIARKGKICVQIHGGSPAEASYKDIVIEEL